MNKRISSYLSEIRLAEMIEIHFSQFFSYEVQGRQLQTMNGNGYTIGFKYNDSGIRTSKTVNGVTTNYYLDGDKVICEDTNGIKTYYTYDSTGKLISMNYSGANYYYVRNAQGDIIALIDENGNRVANYTYDSWGKLISIKDQYGNNIADNPGSIGNVNPYRYRGYRYDTETGLYYLNSRYYNPEWGRFINADSIVGQTGELLSHNMFIYCKNNAINMVDSTGLLPAWVMNTLNMVCGAFGVSAGVSMIGTGISTGNIFLVVGGGLVALHGANQFVSGFTAQFSGSEINPEKSLAQKCFGKEEGEMVYDGYDILLGALCLGYSINTFNKLNYTIPTVTQINSFKYPCLNEVLETRPNYIAISRDSIDGGIGVYSMYNDEVALTTGNNESGTNYGGGGGGGHICALAY